jgi:hypothetical protein
VKILILNQDWFAEELRLIGHEVLTCGVSEHLDVVIPHALHHIDSIIKLLPNGFHPDRIIWLDNSSPLLLQGLEESDIPIIFYSVDTQHHYELHSYLARCFDYIYIAQADYMENFAEHRNYLDWLPLWAPRRVEASFDKRFEATFVGNLNARLNPERVSFFNRLQEILPIHIAQGAYWEIFPHAEIVVNQTVKGDLNFRVFEAMMCGALLLTEHSSNGLLDIFSDGQHLVTYTKNDIHDAAAKIRQLLDNKPRMREIARAGREEVLTRHTAMQRAEKVDRCIRSLEKRSLPANRYFATMINFNVVSANLEECSRPISIKAILAAMSSAEKALTHGAIPTDVEVVHLIRSVLRYERLVGTKAAYNLLQEYGEVFPGNKLLLLACIRKFLNHGEIQAARKLAVDHFQEQPSEVFTLAEQAVLTILEAPST